MWVTRLLYWSSSCPIEGGSSWLWCLGICVLGSSRLLEDEEMTGTAGVIDCEGSGTPWTCDVAVAMVVMGSCSHPRNSQIRGPPEKPTKDRGIRREKRGANQEDSDVIGIWKPKWFY